MPWENFRGDIEAHLAPEAERKSMADRKPTDAIVFFPNTHLLVALISPTSGSNLRTLAQFMQAFASSGGLQ